MAVNSTYYLNGANLATATSVYLDSALVLIAPDGFYSDGIISREQVSGVLLASNICEECEAPVLALRSSENTSNPDLVDVCLFKLDIPVYIITNSLDEIVSGNIVCNTQNPLDTFDGNNKFYLLTLQTAPAGYEYVCQINNVGFINVYILCA